MADDCRRWDDFEEYLIYTNVVGINDLSDLTGGCLILFLKERNPIKSPSSLGLDPITLAICYPMPNAGNCLVYTNDLDVAYCCNSTAIIIMKDIVMASTFARTSWSRELSAAILTAMSCRYPKIRRLLFWCYKTVISNAQDPGPRLGPTSLTFYSLQYLLKRALFL